MSAQAGAQTPPAQPGDTVTITLDQARGLARQAYLNGNIPLANRLAWVLYQADHTDTAALILLAATEPLMGRPHEGRRAGNKAWHSTDVQGLKYEAAFYAARSALFEEKFSVTKFWLRRAWATSETESQRNQLRYDFARVRALSPWTGNLSGAIAPSSNLNGGSQWDWLLIDDTWIVGQLSGSAQALSGWRASIWGELGYKISRSDRQETQLGLGLYHSFNFLSPEAQALAPDVAPGDLDFAVAEAFVDHQRRVDGTPLPDHYRLTFGQTWYGGAPHNHYVTFEFGRGFELPGDRHDFNLEAKIQQTWDSDDGDVVSTELSAGVDYTMAFANGAGLRIGLGVKRALAPLPINDYVQGSLRVGYDFARPIGPVTISVEAGVRGRYYDIFYIGPFAAPNGRTDIEWSGAVNFGFEEVDVLGFTPVISVTASQTRSNITRYETYAYGISLGFESAF